MKQKIIIYYFPSIATQKKAKKFWKFFLFNLTNFPFCENCQKKNWKLNQQKMIFCCQTKQCLKNKYFWHPWNETLKIVELLKLLSMLIDKENLIYISKTLNINLTIIKKICETFANQIKIENFNIETITNQLFYRWSWSWKE